jgi:RNA polymerase primary sigma factor
MMDEDETSGGNEGTDAPLIDLNDGAIKKLIARAKRRGVITMDELNEALPQDQMSTDQIEDIMSAISEMGVNIVESDEDAVDPEEKEVDEVDEVDQGAERPDLIKKKEIIERTDDPVRMYLREMGAVELLSREGEIAIAKRIEAGRDTMILGLCESPITFHAIIQGRRRSRRRTRRRRGRRRRRAAYAPPGRGRRRGQHPQPRADGSPAQTRSA